jgi:FixJ family two-component response regulator
MEHRPTPAAEPKQLVDARERLGELTDKQRDLLVRLASAASVSDAANDLAVSRSNVYASLRRISRKLGVASVPDLLTLVRDGSLLAE